LSVNNAGLAVYDGKNGYFVVDLETGNKSEKIPYAPNLGRDPVFSDNGDIFFYIRDYSGADKPMPADLVCLKNQNIEKFSENWNSYEYRYFPNSFENPSQWSPGSFQGANDFNNKRWSSVNAKTYTANVTACCLSRSLNSEYREGAPLSLLNQERKLAL